MNGPKAARRSPAGGCVETDCALRIARPTDERGPADLDAAVSELVAGQPAGCWPVFSAGYSAGYQHGLTDGYREGLAVLDEAGALLAEARPTRAVDAAAARRQRGTYERKPQTSAQLRAQARHSWGQVERDVKPDRRRTARRWGRSG